MLTLTFAKRGSHGAVEARLFEALQQISLEHVNASFRSVRPAVLRDESIKRRSLVQPDTSPHEQMRGNPAQEERDTWTQSYADQHPRRSKATFVGSDERTAQKPFRWLACLQLDGDCRCAVGKTRIVADRCAVTSQKHPTKARNASAASWNRISARWTRVLLMLIPSGPVPRIQLRRAISSPAAGRAVAQNRDVHLVSTPADRRLEGGATPADLAPAC